MIIETATPTFQWADYVVLSLSMVASIGIGIFFYIYDRKKKRPSNNEEFLMAGRNINPYAVGLSCLGSMINAIFLIGGPVEVYRNGLVFSLVGIAWALDAVIAIFFIVPSLRKLKMVSGYEFLGQRYNSMAVRVAGSLVFIVAMVSFLAVVLYAPSLAFSQVTGVSIHLLQISFGLVCTFYTFMGGLKAVIWTDTIQLMIMIIGTIAVGLMGTYSVGGASEVWRINLEGNRINFNELSFDPRVRTTVWTQIFFHIFLWLPNYGANQIIIQRYMVLKSNRDVSISIIVAGIALTVLLFMICINGLVMYAYFADCDPLKDGRVNRPDQMFAHMLMELLGGYPGIPGLYTAAVFAAALSSVSSAINSLTVVIIEDFIKPLFEKVKERNMTEKSALWIAKALTLLLGFLTIAISYIAPLIDNVLIQILPTVWGTVMAPLLGTFLLAMHAKSSNAMGVLTGLVVSLIFAFWWTISSVMYGHKTPPLQPLGDCYSVNSTKSNNLTMMTESSWNRTFFNDIQDLREPLFQDLYDVSYTYYGFVNTGVSVLVGFLVSILVNCITKGRSQTVRINENKQEMVSMFGHDWPKGQSMVDRKVDQINRNVGQTRVFLLSSPDNVQELGVKIADKTQELSKENSIDFIQSK